VRASARSGVIDVAADLAFFPFVQWIGFREPWYFVAGGFVFALSLRESVRSSFVAMIFVAAHASSRLHGRAARKLSAMESDDPGAKIVVDGV
jgi:hypothetical protein